MKRKCEWKRSKDNNDVKGGRSKENADNEEYEEKRE